MVGVLFSVYNREIDESLIEVWWRLFEEEEFEVVERAFYDFMRAPNEKYFWPVPANIMHHVEKINVMKRFLELPEEQDQKSLEDCNHEDLRKIGYDDERSRQDDGFVNEYASETWEKAK